MMNRENAYFEGIKAAGHAYEEKRTAHKAKKQEIIDTLGWDSEELKAWYTEDAAMEFPFPEGTCKAYRAWAGSIVKQEDEVEMEDFLWDREVADFIGALRKAGIGAFVYTNTSTAAMENLHAFAKEGCTLDGLCTITRRENRWGEEEPYEVQGIRFMLD